MNLKVGKLIITLLVLAMAFSYTNTSGICECTDCTDCQNAINDNTCSKVILANNISCSGSLNISRNDLELNCEGHSIMGSVTSGNILLENVNNITISSCIIKDFPDGIYVIKSLNIYLRNITLGYDRCY